MAQTVNQFFKGINTDSDNTKIQNSSVRLNQGWRVIETAGKGYVNTLIPGTQYQNVIGAEVGFKLSPGFHAMGRATYLGVSFCVSHNPNTGETEFGCFPAPKLDVVGFDNVYRPLKNYLGLTNPYAAQSIFANNDVAYLAFLQAFQQDFRVSMDMDAEHPVRVDLRLEYDNSINIYFCDGKNPIKVINSGFNIYTGMRTKKAFYVEMLDHAINLMNETDQPARLLHDPANGVEEVEIGYNGRFKCGNLIFYFRYSDMDFNPTSFLSQSGAVSIIPSNEALDKEPQSFSGGPDDKETNKSVKLNFEVATLDTSYKYLEIAYVRHKDSGTFETALIGKRWEIIQMITGASNGAYQIEITDTEDKKVISKEEIMSIKRTDDIPVDLKIFEDRLFIGNLKAYDESALYADLISFAQLITCEADISYNMTCKPAHSVSTVTEVGYKNYRNVYHYAAYAAGETYLFGVQYQIKKTGKWTETFPITGRDDILGINQPNYSGNVVPNPNGAYRFPKNHVHPFATNSDTMKINGIKFNVPAIPAAISGNISAVRFTRAERKKNLLYQGVICKAFGSHSDPAWGRYANKMTSYNPSFFKEPFAFHYNNPSGFTGDPAETKRMDGRGYVFYSSTRAFPTPFTFNPKLTDFNPDIKSPSSMYEPDINEWRDFYSWDGGNCCNNPSVPSLLWLRAKVPWLLYVNDPHCHLHRTSGVIFNANGTFSSSACNGGGKTYAGISFKGDYGNFHEGPTWVIPGWQKGYWGIYSLDFAISEKLNESSYFIEKVGQFDTGNTSVLSGPYNTAGDSGSETNSLVDYMMDMKYWNFVPAGWTIPYCGANATNDLVFKGMCYKIGQWNVYPNQIFASYFMEGSGEKYDADIEDNDADGEDDAITGQNLEIQRSAADFHFYYFHQKNRAKKEGILEIKNMEFGVAPYIGVDFTALAQDNTYLDGTPKFWHKDLVNVYMVNPANVTVADWYTPSNEFFFPISNHIYISELGAAVTCYRGDCFPQHAYMRIVANPRYNPHARDDDYEGFVGRGLAEAKFGHLIGYAGEHFHNVGLRHSATYEQSRVREEYDVETFYPAISPLKPEEYAQYNRARESYRYNDGYSVQLSWAVSSGYDISIPYRRKEYPCRIAFSGKNIAGEISDSMREFKLTSHRDYESHTGALTGLAAKNGKFYSIYQSGIRMHYVNELQQVQSTAGAIIIGTQTDVLHEKAVVLTDSIGSQHTQGVIETDSIITGIDYNKRVIWAVVAATGEFHVSSIEKSINSDVQGLIDSINQISDVRVTLDDTPSSSNFEGISVGYNRKYREVWYSINKPSAGIKKTWIYSEKLGQFTGTLPIHIPMYVTINEDFYGIDYANNLVGDTYFHLMDVPTTLFGLNNYQYFFGVEIPAIVKFVVNINSGIDKVFDALWVHMNEELLESVDYATMYQSGSHAPFNDATTPIYIKPRYSENKWQFPIKRCDVASSHFTVGSAYRGKWLEVTFTVDPSLTGRRLVFLEAVETYLRQTLN